MNILKLIDKIEVRIKDYEEKRNREGNESLYEFYGTKITELRFVICDICDWAMDETREEINKILRREENETEGSTM